MPRKTRTHIVNDAQSPLTPKHLTKQQFGQRLYNLMLGKGWTQSELARRAGLPRDAVSVYVRGKSFPTPLNLRALVEALGVSEIELLPNHTESAINEDEPSFEFKVSPSSPSTAWLRVNRLVTLATAIKIAEILEADRAVDGDRSGSAA